MKPVCSLNGQLLGLAEARLDPMDRGFLFGDALYEVVKVLGGSLLHLAPHLRRLEAGLGRVEIPVPRKLTAHCRELVRASGLESGYLYLQISRGVELRAHVPSPGLEPTVLLMPFERGFDPPASRPMRAVTVPDWRWKFRDIKTTSLMATVLGKLRVRHGGVDEVLFIGPQGEVREGGSTNLFARVNGRWQTHPTDGNILEGITRRAILGLASESDLAVEERAPCLGDLDRWQEAFLCGTTTGIQPLIEVDGSEIGDGTAGPETRRLAEAFDRFEQERV